MLEAIRNKRQTVLVGVVLTIALSGLIAAGFSGRIGQLLTESDHRDSVPQVHRPGSKPVDSRPASLAARSALERCASRPRLGTRGMAGSG